MRKTTLVALAGFATVAVALYAIYAYHPEIDPVDLERVQSFDPLIVEKGRVLAAAGYCESCHTTEQGSAYAGNYAMETGFGTLYSTNITPDPQYGIGNWSEEAFQRAMRKGVDREGRHLFPAFPYDHFTRMSADDVSAIYAFLMTQVSPAQSDQKENKLPFPFNLRFLQAGWKLLFVNFGEQQNHSEKSQEWNRGAYLVEGVTHCGACHTPRNALGAEKRSARYAGAAIDRWIAPALTADNASAIPWTAAEYSDYLKSGATRSHGIAAGPMGPVVHAGLRKLPDEDLNAIGVYLGDLVGTPATNAQTSNIVATSLNLGKARKNYREDWGERLYTTACASCHYNAQHIALGRPDLGINSSLRLDAPDNLIHVILDGVDNETGITGVVMPGFRTAFDDDQIAAIAAYLRKSRTRLDVWPDLTETVTSIRNDGAGSHKFKGDN